MQAEAPWRVGHGYDVHAFEAGRPLILGGIKIEHPQGLAGHSDADVLTHAIMDALLGAARLGDIGLLFPDTDPQWKGADSLDLLAAVTHLLDKNGWGIINVDATLLAQAPKIRPFIERMAERLAQAMGLAAERINLKATTTERLGFVGRQEGMAAEAVALIAKVQPAA